MILDYFARKLGYVPIGELDDAQDSADSAWQQFRDYQNSVEDYAAKLQAAQKAKRDELKPAKRKAKKKGGRK